MIKNTPRQREIPLKIDNIFLELMVNKFVGSEKTALQMILKQAKPLNLSFLKRVLRIIAQSIPAIAMPPIKTTQTNKLCKKAPHFFKLLLTIQ